MHIPDYGNLLCSIGLATYASTVLCLATSFAADMHSIAVDARVNMQDTSDHVGCLLTGSSNAWSQRASC